jgi:acyl carrier protein
LNVLNEVKNILADTLSLGSRKTNFTAASVLLGSVPELDSMAVVNVIAALEDTFGISVADDEISADTFATVGSLAAFVEQKLSARPVDGAGNLA